MYSLNFMLGLVTCALGMFQVSQNATFIIEIQIPDTDILVDPSTSVNQPKYCNQKDQKTS